MKSEAEPAMYQVQEVVQGEEEAGPRPWAGSLRGGGTHGAGVADWDWAVGTWFGVTVEPGLLPLAVDSSLLLNRWGDRVRRTRGWRWSLMKTTSNPMGTGWRELNQETTNCPPPWTICQHSHRQDLLRPRLSFRGHCSSLTGLSARDSTCEQSESSSDCAASKAGKGLAGATWGTWKSGKPALLTFQLEGEIRPMNYTSGVSVSVVWKSGVAWKVKSIKFAGCLNLMNHLLFYEYTLLPSVSLFSSSLFLSGMFSFPDRLHHLFFFFFLFWRPRGVKWLLKAT